jgi:hypothetical protein
MCFRHWNRPRGSPDVRNGFVRFNDPRRISSPRDTQKADGIMSRRSTVDGGIPLLVKGFTIHPQTFFFEDGSRERDRRLTQSPQPPGGVSGIRESKPMSGEASRVQTPSGLLTENRETPLQQASEVGREGPGADLQ